MDRSLSLEMADCEEEIVTCVGDCVADAVADTVTAIEKKESFWTCLSKWVIKVIRKCLRRSPPVQTPEV
jgi:hypothetical protein